MYYENKMNLQQKAGLKERRHFGDDGLHDGWCYRDDDVSSAVQELRKRIHDCRPDMYTDTVMLVNVDKCIDEIFGGEKK